MGKVTYYLRHADLRKNVPAVDMLELMDYCAEVDRKDRNREMNRKNKEG